MKLSKLYTNKPQVFLPIVFNSGLNVVMATILYPKDKGKDTHNLGKSTLGLLIDFCFLSNRKEDFFLFKHEDIFSDFIFFLEIELFDGSFVTVKRSVKNHSKIDFALHEDAHRDFSNSAPYVWSHQDIPLSRARIVLDGLLDLSSLGPEGYRRFLGYLFRTQDDYQDVFTLKKFSKGPEKHWKPFLARVLGLDSDSVQKHYDVETMLEDKGQEKAFLLLELGEIGEDVGHIEGLIHLKTEELAYKSDQLSSFDFSEVDKRRTAELVEGIDNDIAELNGRRYTLTVNRKRILTALEDERILFSTEKAKKIYAEAGIFFEGQLKKDFDQLIAFNRAIADERKGYLRVELEEIETEIRTLNSKLDSRGVERSKALSFLGESEVLKKFIETTWDLANIRAELFVLEKRKSYSQKITDIKAEIDALIEERTKLHRAIEKNVASCLRSGAETTFTEIRKYFNEIVEEVQSKKALLSVRVNNHGHLEFVAGIVNSEGIPTSEDKGHSYKKLLCVAFDMAVVRAYLSKKFPRTIYHDGVFESLDHRKKEKLLRTVREYTELGVQQIITLIDSDLPQTFSGGGEEVFEEHEVIVRLDDRDEKGRLFKMPSW